MLPEPEMIKSKQSCFGYCDCCEKVHSLNHGNAMDHCYALMSKFESKGRIDFEKSDKLLNSVFSIDYLFGKARGQMFGVLECEDCHGNTLILKAFSGQYNGIWKVDGWIPPLFAVREFDELVSDDEKRIKTLGREIERTTESFKRQHLIQHRKKLSQRLMKEIHGLYKVHNFRSQVRSLYDFFSDGIPTGTGDCCAPKLLNYAAQNQLKPLSLSEFYWGRENRSKTRQHGRFYSSCKEKCQPILGFMQCGIDQ